MPKISPRFCKSCNKQVAAVQSNTPNHLLHAVITLFLCGTWLPVWIFVSMLQDWRCPNCGKKTPSASDRVAFVVLIFLLLILGLVVLSIMFGGVGTTSR